MDFKDYIRSELLVLVPVLYYIGICLKKSKCPDKLIPYILGIISVLLSALWVFGTSYIGDFRELMSSLFVAITQGILIAGTSVYINQLYIQSKKEK